MARGFGATLGVGSTDRLTLPAFTTATVQSYAGWFYRNGSGGGAAGRIIDANTAGGMLLLWNNATTRLSFQRVFSTTTGTWDVTAGAGIGTGAWVHFVICHDASSTANNAVIYINGQSVAVTTTAPTGSFVPSSVSFFVGNRSANDRNWDGLIGDLAIWNGGFLSAAEARALYQGADPRTIEPRYLVEYVSMRSGRPESLVRAANPTTTGTKIARDFAPVQTTNAGGWLANVLAAGNLVGATSISFTPSGTLTGTGALSGATSLSFMPTATLVGSGALQGATSLAFTPTGALMGAGALSGATSLSFTLSGTLTAPAGAMTGSSSFGFTPVGTLTGLGALSGVSSFSFALSGTLGGGAVSTEIVNTPPPPTALIASVIIPNGEIVPIPAPPLATIA